MVALKYATFVNKESSQKLDPKRRQITTRKLFLKEYMKMISNDESYASESENDDTNWEKADEFLSRYPDPFRGREDENVYDFVENLEAAFEYNRLAASCRVRVLKRLVKG